MRKIYLLTVIFIIGCKSSGFIHKQDFFSLESKSYTFSDSDIRNLEIYFLNDTLVEISNNVAGLQSANYYLYNFKLSYKVKKVDAYRYVLLSLNHSSNSLEKEKYILPYRKNAIYSKKDIFPDVNNDTIFFSEKFENLLIKEFSFNLKK